MSQSPAPPSGDPAALLRDVVRPTLLLTTAITGLPLAGPRAEVMVLASGLQESGLRKRVQVGAGGRELHHLARSFWQFERIGVLGVEEILRRRRCGWALDVLRALGCPATAEAVHRRIGSDDALGCALARVLLWSHPRPLPATDDPDGAWEYYRGLWRPGKPHPARWPRGHATAVRTVTGAAAVPGAPAEEPRP